MAILKTCGYLKAWVGPCKNEVSKEGEKCNKHKDIKCAKCGAQAVKECEETYQFVCGTPLCDNCKCGCRSEGLN